MYFSKQLSLAIEKISGASAETRAAIADLILLREQFIKNRVIFVESSRMIAILKVLGATDEDMEKMRTVSNNLLDDPTLPFRKSKNGRFCFDFKQSQVRCPEFWPFTLPIEEDFVRHDSGYIRKFQEIDEDL